MILSADDDEVEQFDSGEVRTTDCSFENIPNPAEFDTAEVVENAKSVTGTDETDDLPFRREVLH